MLSNDCLCLHRAFPATPPHFCTANSVKSAQVLTQLSLANKERRNFLVFVSLEHLHPLCSSSLIGVCMEKTSQKRLCPKIPLAKAALRYQISNQHHGASLGTPSKCTAIA